MNWKWYWWGWMGLLLIAACGHDSSVIAPSFYHWKTRFSPSAGEKQSLKQLGVVKLYIKYFDVDWPEDAGQAQPQARVDFAEIPEQKVTPTVFITNRAIQKTGEANCPALADKIYRLIFSLHPETLPPPQEVQIDCDWTESTRAAYFTLLTHLGKRLDSLDITLSATIRLHQLKYPKLTGVPPVDRGMLMFYNMGDLDNPQEDNSILDIAEGKLYLGNLDQYVLPLDAALPIFAWGVLIRNGHPIKLLNNMRINTAENIPWLSKISENELRVDSSHYFGGHYLYVGDQIRFEEVTPRALMEAADLLGERLPIDTRSVSLYHLDSLTIGYYQLETLDSVFKEFQ